MPHGTCLAQAFPGAPRHDSRSARHIEDAIAGREVCVVEERRHPRVEDRSHELLLVYVGEARAGEETRCTGRLRRLVRAHVPPPRSEAKPPGETAGRDPG
jgi:hypothetical protein